VDPEFQRILFRVMLVGGVILALGAGTLVIAFRAFGAPKSDGRDFRAASLIAALLAFVLLMCLLLLRLSMLR